jgi:hypothetical protein
MKQKLINFIAIFLLMLITGVFWGTWFTLTRSIEEFSPEEFIHIGKVIISNVAVPMRIIMPSGIVFLFLSLWLSPQKGTRGFYSGLVSFVLLISVLLITLLVLVPIDNDINTWTASDLPQDFTMIRDKWKMFHAIRTFLSLISFGCCLVFVLPAGDKS